MIANIVKKATPTIFVDTNVFVQYIAALTMLNIINMIAKTPIQDNIPTPMLIRILIIPENGVEDELAMDVIRNIINAM